MCVRDFPEANLKVESEDSEGGVGHDGTPLQNAFARLRGTGILAEPPSLLRRKITSRPAFEITCIYILYSVDPSLFESEPLQLPKPQQPKPQQSRTTCHVSFD